MAATLLGLLVERTGLLRKRCRSSPPRAQIRRAAPWPDFALERIEKLAAAHKTLPVPRQAGRQIGIKKK